MEEYKGTLGIIQGNLLKNRRQGGLEPPDFPTTIRYCLEFNANSLEIPVLHGCQIIFKLVLGTVFEPAISFIWIESVLSDI